MAHSWSSDEPESTQWRRNLAVLWAGSFIAGIGFSEIMPFLSLYVAQMGDFTRSELTLYSGVTYAATFMVVAIVSPIWGRLADRHGRKLMLLRASFGMAFIIGSMGFVHNVYLLIILRMLQGLCAGYISNAAALVATETPKVKAGSAIGTLATGQVSGTLIGPVLGGVLAQVFSIRLTFVLTGVLLFVVFLLTLFFVHEHYVPPAWARRRRRSAAAHGEVAAKAGHEGESAATGNRLLRRVGNPKGIIALLAATLVIQMCNNSIVPILSLYVKQLMNNTGPITVVAGIIAALPGMATLLAAPQLGRIGDRIGTGTVLAFGFVFATIMYVPQGLVLNIWALAVFRLMIGISDGALYPTVQTLLSKDTPQDLTGTVFSWNQSFQALGSMVGSLMGGFVSNMFGYNGVFLFTAAALFIMFLVVRTYLPEVRLRWRPVIPMRRG